MTKFLKQTCAFEKAVRNSDGTVQLDKYGEIQYEAPQILKCRREKTIRDIQTGTGAILRTYSRYFLDEVVNVTADDRLDGKQVLEVEEYTNQLGKTEGFECYV